AGIETPTVAGRAIELAIAGFDYTAFRIIAVAAAGIEVMQHAVAAAVFAQTEDRAGAVVAVFGTVAVEPGIAAFDQSGVSIELVAAGHRRIIEHGEKIGRAHV